MEQKRYIDIQAVKRIMQTKGIDEKTLAELTGYTLPTIRAFLNGKNQSRHPYCKLFAVARALGVPADTITCKDNI